MIRKIIIVLFFLVAASAIRAESKKSWTYFFYIAADNYHNAADYDYENRRLVDKYQPMEMYKELRRLARKDKKNNYAIFFDPKGATFHRINRHFRRRAGRPAINTQNHVRFEYYRKGKLQKENSVWDFETDCTRVKNWKRLAEEAKKYIGFKTIKNSNLLLYYYGEHIYSKPVGPNYDLSEKPKVYMTMDKFLKGMAELKQFGRIKLMIAHTCVNTMKFLDLLSVQVDRVLTSSKAIPRARLKLEALRQNSKSADDIIKRVKKDNLPRTNKDHPFSFVDYKLGKDFKKLKSNVLKLMATVDKTEFKDAVQNVMKSFYEIKKGHIVYEITELFTNEVAYMVQTKELIVNMMDYISFVTQYSYDEEVLLEVLEYFEENEVYTKLMVQLNQKL